MKLQADTVHYSEVRGIIVRKILKSGYYFRHVCPSVRAPACNNSVPTGQIFIKFDI